MPAVADQTDLLLRVRGIVQGVGYRPFVQRTASRLGLRGWVRNDAQGVLIRAIGPAAAVRSFAAALREQAPAAARVAAVESRRPDPAAVPAGEEFAILASPPRGLAVTPSVPPDLALCPACREELLDPRDRRRGYPFINCTQCGPRYSLIEALPYDRPRTTMRAFRMCPACQAEYDDPFDRRFHAQPNACPQCGPRLILTGPAGEVRAERDAALAAAVALLRDGRIVAVKGVGGYHLMVDATAEAAVLELRRRKHREEKPLAVMFRDLAAVRAVAEVPDEAGRLLTSPAAPIVLLARRPGTRLAESLAPRNPWIGALLPYTPLHVLLLRAHGGPLVATSANLSEEPLCTAAEEAHERLAGIADAFLDHDRPIAHPVDDSVMRLAHVGPILLRRARGWAPAPLGLPGNLPGHLLCVGAQMKNTVGVAAGDQVVLSPHIGDLAGAATLAAFRRTIEVLGQLHEAAFSGVACDKHPDYASTQHALRLGLPVVAVQHHLAHVLACLLEHQHPADGVLGVSWDGTGYGEDGTVWGGEFILLQGGAARRFGRLRPFRLAGGEAAVRDARRVALGLIHEAMEGHFGPAAHGFGLGASESATLHTMLVRGLNSPVTSSAGRLFDGVGALLGLGTHNQFEGQTPLAVEAAARSGRGLFTPLALAVREAGAGADCELDWAPLLEQLLARRAAGQEPGPLALAFHRALAHGIVEMARRAGAGTVALTGGCFQNALLLDLTAAALREAGFRVLFHRDLPPNDGNIAAGQALGALWNLTTVTLPA
ncbi:MAG: carbamoyltransferase HypF [Verrucomicrobia bacterium]|nr:carbamoyltransferase HypF [Verrucomicrobiota bacterium]